MGSNEADFRCKDCTYYMPHPDFYGEDGTCQLFGDACDPEAGMCQHGRREA